MLPDDRAAGVQGGWTALVRYYEDTLKRHGATPAGLAWPSGKDLAVRFGVMSEMLDGTAASVSLLDVGCGPGLLLDYLAATDRLRRVRYHGIDLSETMISEARSRWPSQTFSRRDIAATPLPDESVDVVIMNGVLTVRPSVSLEAMTALAKSLVAAAFRTARLGIVFNVMNAHVDWQREDLFHWPFDELASFLRSEISPHYEFRADYGLYEYTCFVRRGARTPVPPSSPGWWSD